MHVPTPTDAWNEGRLACVLHHLKRIQNPYESLWRTPQLRQAWAIGWEDAGCCTDGNMMSFYPTGDSQFDQWATSRVASDGARCNRYFTVHEPDTFPPPYHDPYTPSG